MSLYLPGLSLPKDKYDFPLEICVTADGTVTDVFGCQIMNEKAIEVSEHGRLIDADALRAVNNLGTDCSTCQRDARSCRYEMIHSTMDFCEWIDDAPTIIPADKEEP